MEFFAPGKLMISGEYVVLDGALSLAIPTAGYGQHLKIDLHTENRHRWISKDVDGEWFSAVFSLDLKRVIHTSDRQTAQVLLKILQFIKGQNSGLFELPLSFISKLDFNRHWGWGSSSTLIANLAQWSNIDAYQLLAHSFGGSGYDLAVALAQQPILYQLQDQLPENMPEFSYLNKFPVWEKVFFNPVFKDDLSLIYLNQKQNSREEIKKYRQQEISKKIIDEISEISKNILNTSDLSGFEQLLNRHETLLSQTLNRPTVKEHLFADYPGSIKSLGAWGGDFVLATGTTAPEYFARKGYQNILPLKQILPKS